MSLFRNILKNSSVNKNAADLNQVSNEPGWFKDRYQTIVVQRNLLFLLTLVMTITVLISVLIVGNIATKYKIEPFVINLEKTSGITTIVNPLDHKDLLTNESLNRYFILKYIKSRETYNDADYKHNYDTIVRLYSTSPIYSQFRKFINYDPNSPLIQYGTNTSTIFRLRSLQFLNENGKTKAVVRFTIESERGKAVKLNKIATVQFSYSQMELNLEDRSENPLGFQISAYRIDEELL